jgi:hypothetical protein
VAADLVAHFEKRVEAGGVLLGPKSGLCLTICAEGETQINGTL